MEEKKIHGIRVTPATARRLKVMSAQVGLSQGDLLSVLLTLAADGKLSDEQVARAMTENLLRGYSLPQGGPR